MLVLPYFNLALKKKCFKKSGYLIINERKANSVDKIKKELEDMNDIQSELEYMNEIQRK